jgi:hypothetical protein
LPDLTRTINPTTEDRTENGLKQTVIEITILHSV